MSNYIDNGDGTVTQTGVTQIVSPNILAEKIKEIQTRKDALNQQLQKEIDILSNQLQDIYAQVPTVVPQKP